MVDNPLLLPPVEFSLRRTRAYDVFNSVLGGIRSVFSDDDKDVRRFLNSEHPCGLYNKVLVAQAIQDLKDPDGIIVVRPMPVPNHTGLMVGQIVDFPLGGVVIGIVPNANFRLCQGPLLKNLDLRRSEVISYLDVFVDTEVKIGLCIDNGLQPIRKPEYLSWLKSQMH